ncbi:MAG: PA14 domain-containing protein [Bacteroidota bacterium]
MRIRLHIRFLLITLSLSFSALNAQPIGGPTGQGQWTDIIQMPIVSVATANLPNGKVLTWSAYDRFAFGGNRGRTYTVIFDPETNQSEEFLISNTGHDMFCPGIANLPDGSVVVTGGSSSPKTSVFDPFTNAWVNSDNMNIPRGYHAMAALPDGNVFTVGGSWSGGRGGKTAEIWNSSTGDWTTKSGIPADVVLDGTTSSEGVYRNDNHSWLWVAPNGKIFHAGPSFNMHWIDYETGNGSYTSAGRRGDDVFAMNGNTVMYDTGKLLKMGGAETYSQGTAASGSTYIIDINTDQASVKKVESMQFPRTMHNTVVLPTGEVFVAGGLATSRVFSDNNARLTPELWNPETETWRSLAPMQVPRTYHSVGILLPDGRVMFAGGGLCGGCSVNHADAEIYSPPYLFNTNGSLAARPSITSAPASAPQSSFITINTDKAISSFAIIRYNSATHSTNNEQRRIELSAVKVGNNQYQLSIPNTNVAIPGYYMLFAMDAAGVPSVSHTIQLDPSAPAQNKCDVQATTLEYNLNDEGWRPISGNTLNVETGDKLLLSANPNGQKSYTWTGPANFSKTGNNNGDVLVANGIAANMAGTYEVTLTYTNDCVKKKSFTLTVENTSPPPPACDATGTISASYWYEVGGVGIADIPLNQAPDENKLLTIFETPANATDNYAVRIRGYVCAPQTGNYTFWIASDDNGELWVSSDDTPSNKSRVAFVPGWTPTRNWTKFSSQKSAAIRLEQGKKYYVEALMKEGGGGDNLSVGWTLPNGQLQRPIPGASLSPFEGGEKIAQTITLNAISNKSVSTPPFQANASSSSGLPVSLSIKSGPASISGSTITLNGTEGTVVVEAKQNGNQVYAAATPVSRSFRVNQETACNVSGQIFQEIWEEIGSGNSVSDIPLGTAPDKTAMLSLFETPTGAGEAYGTRVSGFICPPESGKYTFYIASDDNGELWLSTDDTPANKRKIASVPGWTAPREWTKFPQQTSSQIDLVAGRLYYVEALMKEGAGGDNLAVGWRLPDGTFDRPISGVHLGPSGEAGKQPQSINFTAIPNKTVGDPPFNVSATASSGLGVTYSILSGPANINGNTVTLTGGAGEVRVRAAQAGNDDVNSAEAIRTFFVFDDSNTGCSGTGTITLDSWTNVPGMEVADIPLTTSPSSTKSLAIFEIAPDTEDEYASRIRGFICPPLSGQYTFWLASDDHGELWLSTNDNPANKRKIADVIGWTPYRNWDFRTSQKSAAITLVAGQKYYVEALQKEGGGGDNLSVGWQLPDGKLERPIPGVRLTPFSAAVGQQAFTPTIENTLLTDEKITVYPNPTQETLYFSWDGLSEAPESFRLRLCDVTGKCVVERELSMDGAQLRVSNLAAGVYQLIMEAGTYRQLSRVMILE